ncbi:AsnC-family transcriptional regulator [Erwinia amylovora MR1]|nr:AsnC-family transcriptional regulator [Erwinia amylovora MR1]
MLQVVAGDLDAYADFSMTVLRRLTGIKAMQSMFVMTEIKPLTSYPIKATICDAIP